MRVELDESKLNGLTDSLEETQTEEVEDTQEEQEQVQEEETREEQVQRIKLGEKEYTQDELNELVGLGSRAKEVGDSHGGFDKFVTEYGRKSQTIGELKKQLEELEAAKNRGDVGEVEDSLQEAKEAARKLGIVLKDDLESWYQSRRNGEVIYETCKDLEKEIDGTDGRPKFNADEVLQFMLENPGFKDPQRAYNAMHMDNLDTWRASKLVQNQTRKGIATEVGVGTDKRPKEVKVTAANLHTLLSEQFSQ